jgi:transposase
MYTQKVTKRYSEAIKHEVISKIESGLLTKSEAVTLYDISRTAIVHWIKRAGKQSLLNKVIRIQMPNEINVIKRLEQEKRALESALAQATLKIITLESTLKVLEEETGVTVKKSTVTGLSNVAGHTESLTKGTTR